MQLETINGLITELCLKGELDKELGVCTGLWMSEGTEDGDKGTRSLTREAWIPKEELGHFLRLWDTERGFKPGSNATEVLWS